MFSALATPESEAQARFAGGFFTSLFHNWELPLTVCCWLAAGLLSALCYRAWLVLVFGGGKDR